MAVLPRAHLGTALLDGRLLIRRFVLTGAPGCGKTSILRELARRGHMVVEESATAVIAAEQARGVDEPWRDPRFLDAIVAVQRERREEADRRGAAVQVHDRSPVCTLALARWLGHPVPAMLAAEVARAGDEYERRAFLVEPIGSCAPTAARRMSYEDSVRFGLLHEATYRELGFELVRVPPGPVEERAAAVAARLGAGRTD